MHNKEPSSGEREKEEECDCDNFGSRRKKEEEEEERGGNESLLNLTPDCLLTESRSLADESEQRITTGVSSWPEREIYSQR